MGNDKDSSGLPGFFPINFPFEGFLPVSERTYLNVKTGDSKYDNNRPL